MLTPSLISLNNAQSFVVDKPTVVIGRSKQRADFRIPDPHVSSVHCEIHFNQDVLTVKDKSKHGTWVNDEKVEEATVADGDVLRVVGHEFRVQWNPELSRMAVKDWLIQMAGMELGPLPWDELELMVQRGEVCPTDQVKATGSSDWQNVSELEHLFRDEAQELVTTSEDSTDDGLVDDDESTTFSFDAEDEAATSEFELPQSADANEGVDEPANVGQEGGSNSESDLVEEPSVGDTVVAEHSLIETTTDLRTDTANESDNQELSGDELLDSVEEGDSDEYELATSIETEERPKASVPAIESAAQESSSDVAEYFYRIGDVEAGPVPLAEIQQLIEAGKLDETHEVRAFGKINWESVSTIAHQFALPMNDDSLEDDSDYDSELLSDADQPDAELTLDPKESLPFGEPTVRRVNFDYQPVVNGRKNKRASAGFGFGDWALGAYGYAQTNRIVAVSCLLILGWLIYGLIPKYEGVEVFGTVTLDDEPLKNASITFRNLNTGLSTTVGIAEDGKYEATTLEGGLEAGSYQISFMPQKPESQEVIRLLQEIYREQQGLQVGGELKPSDLASGDIGTSPEYKRKKLLLPRGTIPVKLRSTASSGLRREIDSESSPVDFKLTSNE